MRFKRGYYALLISKACFPRLALVLEELIALGTPASRFAKSLEYLGAEIGRGADIPDLEPFAATSDEFAITLHGYRVRLMVSGALSTITLLDIDPT